MKEYSVLERVVRRKVRKKLRKQKRKASKHEYEELVAEEEDRLVDRLQELL